MGECKTQLWLRPDQVDLLRSILLVAAKEAEGGGVGKLEKQLMAFCHRRVADLLAVLAVEAVRRIVGCGKPSSGGLGEDLNALAALGTVRRGQSRRLWR